MTTVYLSSDHRGFELKNRLLKDLPASLPYSFQDLGPAEYRETDDYNDAAISVARALKHNPNNFGLLLCGSGVGVSIQANRFKGIRAALVSSPSEAETARLHNSANVLCLSADAVTNDDTYSALLEIITTFLSTPFSNQDRHARRIKRLDEDVIL